jgi:hypothetical protein
MQQDLQSYQTLNSLVYIHIQNKQALWFLFDISEGVIQMFAEQNVLSDRPPFFLMETVLDWKNIVDTKYRYYKSNFINHEKKDSQKITV